MAAGRIHVGDTLRQHTHRSTVGMYMCMEGLQVIKSAQCDSGFDVSYPVGLAIGVLPGVLAM